MYQLLDLRFITIAVLCCIICVHGFLQIYPHHHHKHQKNCDGIHKSINIQQKQSNYIINRTYNKGPNNTYRNILKKTSLQIDIFGLGPTEIVVIIAAGALLYPRNNNKKKSKSERNSFIPEESWEVERNERIMNMRLNAEKMRSKRTLERINEAILNDNEYVLDRMAQYEDMKDNETADI